MSTADNEFLAGKSALVTGSTSGIGLGIARRLAAAGANVMVNGLGDRAQIDAAVQSVAAAGPGDVVFSPANMIRPGEIAAMVDDAVGTFGGIDILVNNAGIQFVSPIQDFPPDKWDDIIAINLSSSFHTIRAATPHMLAAGWGRIVNIASLHALVASPYKAAYVAAKHGVAGLTKVVALELAQQNITVNSIAPGYVETPLVTGQVADTARARGITEEEVVRDVMLAAQPTKKFIQIDEIAAMVIFLCGDAAASITGAILPVDGGWSAQ
ncbi:MAG TPA: 3-hydroxybutyrate dehydrogenase [Woeseiaceae bacterium]|nr:3-hydroxybutyrate dehydrogenase [Woeseiaceae bacterium]